MSEQAHAAGEAHGSSHHTDYTKVWMVLVGLLVVSIAPWIAQLAGMNPPMAVTLVLAFGIACIKAFMVVKYFMHINLERKWITYMIVTMLVLMFLMVGGVAPDVLRHKGTNWTNVAAQQEVERGLKAGSGHGEHGDVHPQGEGHNPSNAAPAHGEGEAGHGEAPHGEAAH